MFHYNPYFKIKIKSLSQNILKQASMEKWAKCAKSVDISLRKKWRKKKFFVQILLCHTRSCQPIDTIFETQVDGTQMIRTMC